MQMLVGPQEHLSMRREHRSTMRAVKLGCYFGWSYLVSSAHQQVPFIIKQSRAFHTSMALATSRNSPTQCYISEQGSCRSLRLKGTHHTAQWKAQMQCLGPHQATVAAVQVRKSPSQRSALPIKQLWYSPRPMFCGSLGQRGPSATHISRQKPDGVNPPAAIHAHC
jgi:hypothetical protein